MENRDAQNSNQDPTKSQQSPQQPTSQNETDGGEMGQSGQSNNVDQSSDAGQSLCFSR